MRAAGAVRWTDGLRGEALTRAELDALLGAAAGETIAGTARRLFKSPETIKCQRRRVLGKLGARNMPHAVAIAFRRRLLS